MHLCFIDESGTPPKPNYQGRLQYFVIAGVIMHEAQWHGVAEDIRRLRKKPLYSVSGEIKWRFFGPENDDEDNSVSHLSMEARHSFRHEFFNIVTRRKSIRIITCVTHIASAYQKPYIYDQEALYQQTYKIISERFHYYLQDVSRIVGDRQYGIIVADHRGKKQDDTLRQHHHRLVDGVESVFASQYENYIETLFLTPSHRSVGIQIADMVAGAIGRFFNANDPTYFDLIKGSLRTDQRGRTDGYGLVRFPIDGWLKPPGGA
jgi:Protein of unknown function (DUF3800)